MFVLDTYLLEDGVCSLDVHEDDGVGSLFVHDAADDGVCPLHVLEDGDDLVCIPILEDGVCMGLCDMKMQNYNLIVWNKHITKILNYFHAHEHNWYFGSMYKHKIFVP